MKRLFFSAMLLGTLYAQSQELNTKYNAGSNTRASKQALINNITEKRNALLALSKGYNALVPPGYTVSIEFNPANDSFKTPATIDLHIYGKEQTKEDKGYQLKYGSVELNNQLKRIGWTEQTLEKVKQLLTAANFISIQNGATYNEIGFARSGTGKYGMLLAPKPFNAKEISEYSDDCHYIYYENYVILTYSGGATGPDCFPD